MTTEIRNEDGFSLIEVVVATTLVAMLATLLFSGVSLSGRAMDAGLRRSDTANGLVGLDSFLHNRLAQAQPSPFVGARNRLEFAEVSPEWLIGSPVGRIALHAERAGNEWRLVALWRGTDERSHESPMLEHLAGAEFAYFGRSRPNEAPVWREDWPGPLAPELVRLRVTPADNRPSEDIVVALRVTKPGDQP